MFDQHELLLSIIILNYNTKTETYNCIRSITKSRPDFNYEIILVDNNSIDGSIEFIGVEFPSVKIIKLSSNKGFSYANNAGFEHSNGEYVLFLNSDTLFLSNTMNCIGRVISSKSYTVIAPKLLNEDGTTQKSLFTFPSYIRTFIRISGIHDVFSSLIFSNSLGTSKNILQFDYSSFAAVIFRKDIFEMVGRLDTKILFYHEDCDMGFKLKNNSIESKFMKEIEIVHLGGTSTSNFSQFAFQNDVYSLRYVFAKNYGKYSEYFIRIVLKSAIALRCLTVILGLNNGIRGFRIYKSFQNKVSMSKKKYLVFLLKIFRDI